MRIIDTQGLDRYDPRNLMAEPTGRVFRSRLPNAATEIQLATDKAYFVYVGRTAQPIYLHHVEFYVSTNGSGTNTVEVGLFSTPTPPNNENLSLTKLVVRDQTNIDSLLTAGLKRNTNAFNYAVAAGTYLWAGIRTAGYSIQPKLAGLSQDFDDGLVLTTASAGALTGSGPWSGSRTTPSPYWNSTVAPDLRVGWKYLP